MKSLTRVLHSYILHEYNLALANKVAVQLLSFANKYKLLAEFVVLVQGALPVYTFVPLECIFNELLFATKVYLDVSQFLLVLSTDQFPFANAICLLLSKYSTKATHQLLPPVSTAKYLTFVATDVSCISICTSVSGFTNKPVSIY